VPKKDTNPQKAVSAKEGFEGARGNPAAPPMGITALWQLVGPQVAAHTAVAFVDALVQRHREDVRAAEGPGDEPGPGPGGAALDLGSAGPLALASAPVGDPSLQLVVDVSYFATVGLRSPTTPADPWVLYVLACAMSRTGLETLAKVAEDPSRCVPPLFVGRFFFVGPVHVPFGGWS